MGETLRYVKNVWMEGNNTLCFGIPAEIVKKMNLDHNSYLLVELIDDSVIVMKKHDPQFTKAEINRVISHQDNTSKKPITNEEKKEPEEPFVNPLKDLEL